MKIKIRNVNYNLTLQTFGSQFVYEVTTSGNKKVGSIYYSLNKESYNNYIWLININVEEAYQSKGVGQFLFNLLCNEAILKRVDYIEGKYFPTNEFAKPFYNKNGCEIYKEGYETYVRKDFYKNHTPNAHFTQIAHLAEIEEQERIKKETQEVYAFVEDINNRHDKKMQQKQEQNNDKGRI